MALIKLEFYKEPIDLKNDAVFTTTQRSGLKLVCEGFEFTKQKTSNHGDLTLWACVKKTSLKCRGKAMTRRIGSRAMVELYDVHNHPPYSRL